MSWLRCAVTRQDIDGPFIVVETETLGSDSDPNILLETMLLAHEVERGVHSFGFYRSKEGREFLRRIFPFFLRLRDIREGKVAPTFQIEVHQLLIFAFRLAFCIRGIYGVYY